MARGVIITWPARVTMPGVLSLHGQGCYYYMAGQGYIARGVINCFYCCVVNLLKQLAD